jgi:ribosomal protein S18 acetylase RimI-like enzyme
MREKRRAANQAHAEFGRVKARATARELQTLQRTRTSVDALTTEQLTEMRARISDEIEAAREEIARTPRSPEEIKRARARQWIQLVADGAVAGGVSTGLVSVRGNDDAKRETKFLKINGEPASSRREPTPLPPTKDGKPRERIASATLQVCVPDSAFPPPFPSSKPYRSYLANVAVAPEARRSGVATAIIRYSERLTKLWGFDEMWLHVNIDNPGARALYEGLGYAIVSEDPWFYLDRRYLMRKKLVA